MSDAEKRRFKKFLHYMLYFVFMGIDMSLKINYSFLVLYIFISYQLKEKQKLKDMPLIYYLLGFIFLPVMLKIIFNLIHN